MEQLIFGPLGILAIIFGVFVIAKRKRLVNFISSQQKYHFGKFGEWQASTNRSWGLIIPGVLFIIIGSIFIIVVAITVIE